MIVINYQMNNTYPLHKSLKKHLFIALGLGIWVYLFLVFTEPFDINKFNENEKLLLPIFGLLASISYCIPLLYQFRILEKNSWKIKNEVVFTLFVIILGSIVYFLFYKYFIAYNEPDTYNYFHYVKWIYIPALVIILPFLLIARFLLAKFFETPDTKITIKGKGQYDFINLKIEDLLFIQSSDNYVEINFIENDLTQKKLIRGTISEVEKTFDNLLKTHRSFLINPLHFKQFKIENKKLLVDLGFGFSIPVSRTLQNHVKAQLQTTTNK